MHDCKECENQYWKVMYIASVQRFDKVLARMVLTLIVLSVITAACCITAAIVCVRTQKFIAEYEAVEETEIEIEQDSEGVNTAIIGDESEVKIWGRR